MQTLLYLTCVSSFFATLLFFTLFFTEFGGGSVLLLWVVSLWVPIIIFSYLTTLVGLWLSLTKPLVFKPFRWFVRGLYIGSVISLTQLTLPIAIGFPSMFDTPVLELLVGLLYPVLGCYLLKNDGGNFEKAGITIKFSFVSGAVLLALFLGSDFSLLAGKTFGNAYSMSFSFFWVVILFFLFLLAVANVKYQKDFSKSLVDIPVTRMVVYGSFIALLLLTFLPIFSYISIVPYELVSLFGVVTLVILIRDIAYYWPVVEEFFSSISRVHVQLIVVIGVLIFWGLLSSFVNDLIRIVWFSV